MERIVAIIMITVVALALYGFYWQYANCTTEFTAQMSYYWKLWAMSLGEKASEDSLEADRVAVIRTIVVGVNFITCFFIISGVLRHW